MIRLLLFAALFTLLTLFSCDYRPSTSENVVSVTNQAENTSANLAQEVETLSGKVELRELPASQQGVRFALKNGLKTSIFMAYSKGGKNSEALFMPYDLRCRVGKIEDESVGPDFHFFPSFSPLASGETVQFSVRKPESKGPCSIRITYYEDEAVANLMNEKGVNLTKSDQVKIDKNKKILELKFKIGD